jgi:hypothetical protein
VGIEVIDKTLFSEKSVKFHVVTRWHNINPSVSFFNLYQEIRKMFSSMQAQAIVQKPIKYIENVWGQDIRMDKNKRNFETEMSFWPKFGRDPLITGALPYTTSPRLRKNPVDRMMPVDTRVSRSCWREALAQAGPHYLRHWPIWDSLPFAPSSGDVTKDPRYGVDTRRFTKPYRSLL